MTGKLMILNIFFFLTYCRFISFCRVGTGLSDEELDAVVNKLKPYFRYFLDNLIRKLCSFTVHKMCNKLHKNFIEITVGDNV